MPNIKSQKDRVIQSQKENLHNKAVKSNLKTVVKKADAAIAAGSDTMRFSPEKQMLELQV